MTTPETNPQEKTLGKPSPATGHDVHDCRWIECEQHKHKPAPATAGEQEWTCHEVEPDEWGIWAGEEPIRRNGLSEGVAVTICLEHNAALTAAWKEHDDVASALAGFSETIKQLGARNKQLREQLAAELEANRGLYIESNERKQQLDAAVEDTKRLDWLDTGYGKGCANIERIGKVLGVVNENIYHRRISIREAIDAALAKIREGK